MNIFVSDPCPQKSAKYLDDKRVVKMVLETAQILSTTISMVGGEGPYRVTHRNHPCCKWARESSGNYLWLLKHFKYLSKEYTARYKRIHACERLTKIFEENSWRIKKGSQTVWPNCTIFKKEIGNVHVFYKKALDIKWQNDIRTPTWYGIKRNKNKGIVCNSIENHLKSDKVLRYV